MARTRAQQAKQMLQNGGRIGLRGGGADMGTVSTPGRAARDNREIGARMSRTAASGQGDAMRRNQEAFNTGVDKGYYETFKNKKFKDTPSLLLNTKLGKDFRKFIHNKNIEYFEDTFDGPLTLSNYKQFYQDIRDRFKGKDDGLGDADYLQIPKLGIMATAPSDMDQELEIEEDEVLSRRFRADGGRIGLFKGAQADTRKGKPMSPGTDVKGNVRSDNPLTDDGPSGPPTNVGGGITKLQTKKDIPALNTDFTKYNVQDLINIGLIDDDDENIQVAGLNQEQVDYLNKVGKKVLKVSPEGGDFFTYDNPANIKKQIEKLNPESESLGFTGFSFNPDKIVAGDPNTYATDQDVQDYIKSQFPTLRTGGREIGLAEGGMPYEGGIMDLESARQMYGLGKLVKKIGRSVKKIVKSPLGKAALLGIGAFGLPGGAFGMKGFLPQAFKTGASKFLFGLPSGNPIVPPTKGLFGVGGELALGKGKLGIGSLIGGASLVSGLLTAEQEEEAQQLADDTGFSIEEARNSILARARDDYKMDFRARRFRAEGGSTEGKEPVAKKVMPLLDMDGKEKDYRETGGFVDMGRMEKADDVPARLSKNEFVFTADAVRNAGDGSVDKGAEVMYNMMKNLEAGGDVSEESQGMDGARKMFQTSQRLEEVL